MGFQCHAPLPRDGRAAPPRATMAPRVRRIRTTALRAAAGCAVIGLSAMTMGCAQSAEGIAQATPGALRLGQSATLDMTFGGAEANVAVALAQWGVDVRYLTRLPDNPLGRACRDQIRAFGVDTRFVAFGGSRLGIYFLESGAAQRGSLVVYDRAGSSFATVSRNQRTASPIV